MRFCSIEKPLFTFDLHFRSNEKAIFTISTCFQTNSKPQKESFLPLSNEFKSDNENGELDNTTLIVESMEPAGRMMNLKAANMIGDDEKILSVNEKRTIAPTSNSMQLPLYDNDAKNESNTI